MRTPFVAVLALPLVMQAADRQVSVHFDAVVGAEKFACGSTYKNIGTTKSSISPRDFRFYIHGVELIDESGKSVQVQLTQDGKWQVDDVALLDFEDATGGCSNGTPDVNREIRGTVPDAHYTGLRFILGVPFTANHTDPTTEPSPLNLTALFWTWNGGHKFARLDFSSTGMPRGFLVHLGSTGCSPHQTRITVPTQCGNPNRVPVEFSAFDPDRDTVTADLASLLRDTNVDLNQKDTPAGCMSGPDDSDCSGLFANLGLAFGARAGGEQRFFRRSTAPSPNAGN
jgi:uncharacterized repeat protein (TIGR04052 family)